VTASAAACVWQATTNAAFIAVATGSESGTGSGTARLGIVVNQLGARVGTATVAGHPVTIRQDAAPAPACAFDVWPATIYVFNPGGNSVVNVTSTLGASCSWTAQSQSAFVSIPTGNSGVGSGTFTLTVGSNLGTPARTGTVVVAGQTVTVVQGTGVFPAPNCFFLIANASITNVPASGGTYVATLTKGATPPPCSWTALVQDAFLSINPASGIDGGSISIQVAPNTGYGRFGGIIISPSGEWIIVYQNGK